MVALEIRGAPPLHRMYHVNMESNPHFDIDIMARYLERNTTLFPLPGGRSLLVYEPCNTASNFAYYHMVRW